MATNTQKHPVTVMTIFSIQIRRSDKLLSLGFWKETYPSVWVQGGFPFAPGIQPNPAQLSLGLMGGQQNIMLKECLYLIAGPCSELFGPGIGGSPRESLGAGRRSYDPSDLLMFKSSVPPGVPKSVTESGKIIHSLKLNFGVLESRHSLLRRWAALGIIPP